MSNTLKNNAYHILGLDVSASEKDISKRSKEILNRLLADDTPEYDLDIGMFGDFRTEDSVKDALQRLQSQKKKIKEYFFWLQIADSVDEQVLKFLKTKDYSNAIKTWHNVSDGDGTKNLLYKKNLAILHCLVLSVENNEEYLKDSLRAWEDLINSDKILKSSSKEKTLPSFKRSSNVIVDPSNNKRMSVDSSFLFL